MSEKERRPLDGRAARQLTNRSPLPEVAAKESGESVSVYSFALA